MAVKSGKLAPSKRSQTVRSFLVMELLDEAKRLTAAGKDIVRLEAGEPDLPAPRHAVEAGRRALAEGRTGYTPSPGTTELRETIAAWYADRYEVEVNPERIFVTSGTSPGLLLAAAAVLDRGDEVLIADPGYPGYSNAARFLEAGCGYFPVLDSEDYVYSPERIRERVTDRTKAIMVNSPANPTGARVPPESLEDICSLGCWVISDEIYHEICYEPERCHSALEFTDQAFVLNGCSKRYAMPGLRLGWVIVPEACVRAVSNMNQNFLIGANSISQAAAVAAIRESDADVAEKREIYRERRDLIVARLREIGFGVPAYPSGAFYVFANAERFTDDSIAFARELLAKTGVAVTPGIDFGPRGEGHIRLAYTVSRERIAEGMDRIERYLKSRAR